jgi:cytochrome bd-type quinol oxidase subunit 2
MRPILVLVVVLAALAAALLLALWVQDYTEGTWAEPPARWVAAALAVTLITVAVTAADLPVEG